MRTAFASMAWNTGSSSPGELEMTCSTSKVAVCCSSAPVSLHLVEQSHVLDRDHRLVGKCLHKRDLIVGERFDLQSVNTDDTQQAVAFEHRDRERRPDWVDMARPIRIFGISLSVRDVYRSPLKGSACRGALASRGDRVPFYELSELRRC